MQLVITSLVLLLCPVAEARSIAFVDDDKQNPVTKVVTLLKDMQSQLEKEAEEDEEVYDKVVCWCKTNNKEKTQAIKNAESRVADLGTAIETSAATNGRLSGEIANHESELAKSTKSVDQLTSIRQKQAKEFKAEEKDMLASVSSLSSALTMLAKKRPTESLSSIAEVVRTQMAQHKMMLIGVITPHQKKMFAGNFLQKATAPSYTPQSTEIFGILKQMKETFEGNLADSQKEETANAAAFEEQKSAKMEEVKAITGSLNGKKTQLSKSTMDNAQSKEDLEDTQKSLGLDQKFFADLTSRCELNDSEWEIRKKDRTAEIAAVVEAISILSADTANAQFSKTLSPASFIQTKAVHNSKEQRNAAAQLLNAAAQKTGSPKLAGLALAAKVNAFEEVQKAISNMVTELTEAKKEEVDKRGYCTTQISENSVATEKEVGKKANADMKMQGFTNTISELKTQLDTLKAEITQMNLQIKRAGEDRELMNKDFQQTIADQRETQVLLNKAVTVLKSVFSKKSASLVQIREVGSSGQEPAPAGFSARKSDEGGGGAIGMLKRILSDAKAMEAEATKDEQSQQKTYEKYVQDTNAAIAAKNSAIINKSEDKATATQDMGRAQEDLQESIVELASLGAAKADLGSQCDYLLKNFEIRQQARDEEIEALKQAKSILSSMQND